VSKETFNKLGHYLFKLLWKWACKKHPKVARRKLAQIYFTQVGNRRWVFFSKKGEETFFLLDIAKTKIVRHSMVQKNKNPFDEEDVEYFQKRDKK